MQKTIYSLSALPLTLQAVKLRYLKFPAETSHEDNRRYKGFDLLAEEDAS